MPPKPPKPVAPFWPYDWQALEERLDTETIERQGEFWLHRGLNIKRLIAFIGSGVSVAYGRVTWDEIATLHIDRMCKFGADLELPGAPELIRYIQDVQKEPDTLDSEKLYTALQACEQIWRLIAASGDERLLKKISSEFSLNLDDQKKKFDLERVERAEQGSRLFRYWIKRETYDELPHVRRLIHGWSPHDQKSPKANPSFGPVIPPSIIEAFKPTEEPGTPGPRDRLLDGLYELDVPRELLRRKIGDSHHYHVFFRESFLRAVGQAKLPAIPPRHLSGIIEIYRKLANELPRGVDGNSLRPVRRFSLGLTLDLARFLLFLTAPPGRKGKQRTTTRKPPKILPIERAKIIPVEHDPLRRLTYDLGISRYMTTNYDLEVERLFSDMGFSIPSETTADGADIDEVEAIGPSGGRTRDLVLTERSAIDLVDFAANDSAHEFQVVHLHGRATEHHDIVVTEADYQRTYVSGKPSQQAFRQGLEVAFGGNPILFVGLGLSEGDVMRPLREFMTNPGRDNRAIVALRDGREDALKRKTFAKRAYAQYGVHVLHYGFYRTEDDKQVDWLATVSKAVKKSISGLRTFKLALETYAKNEPETTPELKAKAVKTAIDDIQKQIGDGANKFSGAPYEGNFESDGANCNIKFEIDMLLHIGALVYSLANLVLAAIEEPRTFDDGRTPADYARLVADFLNYSLRPALERAEGAIVTAALNAKLEAIKNGWVGWWKNWRSEPRSRTDFVQYERLDPEPSTAPVWARHFPYGPAPARNRGKKLARGLENFFEAVPKLETNFNDRRVFMLLGPPGAGKGNIYNSFAECGNKLLSGNKLLKNQSYSAQFFTTFSFSIEIASVWDALLAFLHDPWKNPNLFSDRSDETRKRLYGLSRVDALRRVLRRRSRPGQSGGRLLVVLNAFDILLDENGEPKNSEIRRILLLLLGPESISVPLDIVCICRDRRIHGLYVPVTTGLRRPSRVPTGKTSPFVGPSFEEGPTLQGQRLTLLLSHTQREFGEEPNTADEGGRIHGDFLSSLRSMEAFVRMDDKEREKKPWLERELGLDFKESAQSDDVGGTEVARLNSKTPTKEATHSTDFVHILDLSDPLEFDWSPIFDKAKITLLNSAYAAVVNVGRGPKVAQGIAEDKNETLRRLFRVHLQRRRFLYTLIVAVAALVSEKKLTPFLESLIPTLRGPGVSVQDRVIEAVFDFWFDHPKIEKTDIDDPDPVLWEELLRHLAVITTPVTADVLALCPEIAERIDRKKPHTRGAAEKRAAAVTRRIAPIENALRSLASRGLVFILQPAGNRRGDKSGAPRYVVHRAIQRYIYRKLGSQRLDPSESSTFTLSLYTAQQRLYPRLNAASYAFLYKLVHTLSGYPSHDQTAHRNAPEAKHMLRAALGVTRNLLSLGVVSRFSDFDEPSINTSAMKGHLQHHWSIVRWLLSYAQHLDHTKMGLDDSDSWLPFYRDELVWLANECGAFSYAQGQTYDAAALYWLASRFQRNIELLRPGAHRSRLFLNDAWCSIDRARLDDAEGMLKDVYETADEEKVLRLVARGGLALISNIRGRTDLALTEYDYTIAEMQRMQRSRPLSILQRHRGDLKRHLRDRDEAEKDFVRAIETAETSGYIDLVHTTQVARVRNLLEMQVRDPSKLTEALDAAHSYAERMAVPRLLCEVLMVRAELLLKQGQSDVAGQFANRATRIATLNGLILRKIAYLELLARVEKAQGNMASSQRLLSRTVRFARQVGYNLMIERAERERNELAYVRETSKH